MACKKCGDAIGPTEARRLGLSNEQFHVRKFHAAGCPRYKGKSHPSGEVPSDHARRVFAGNARVQAAIEHLFAARDALNAACRDLCSVEGANGHYRVIARMSNDIDIELHDLNLDYIRGDGEPFKLAGPLPTDEQIDNKHGCALEPIS